MKNIAKILSDWPTGVIRDTEIARTFTSTSNARHSAIKRALQGNILTRLRRGLYLITAHTKTQLADERILAHYIYEPSFVSLETALSYHSWIPEAVQVCTSVSPKRAQQFSTPLGTFTYKHVPEKAFYLGVERTVLPAGICFIAQPWRAVADYIYVYAKTWSSLADFEEDMRIDHQQVVTGSRSLLKDLASNYPSVRVRKMLKLFLHGLATEKSTHK